MDFFLDGDWGSGILVGILGLVAAGVVLQTIKQGIAHTVAELTGRPTVPTVKRTRSVPQDVKIAVAVRDGGLCQHCGTDQGPMHYDHVIPYSLGGTNDASNIQLLCARCNRDKSNRYIG